jgi:hypothetical protein
LDVYSISSMKQQSTGRNVAPFKHFLVSFCSYS